MATNLVVRRGESFSREITYADDQGVALDLTGYSVEGQVRRWDGGPLLASFGWKIVPAAGTVTLTLTVADTLRLHRTGFYDVWLMKDGERTLLLDGKLVLRPGITVPGTATPPATATTWGDLLAKTWGEVRQSTWGNI